MANTERQDAAEETSKGDEDAASLTAGYIEDMVGEMEQLADGAGLEALGFLLGRAKEEARLAAAA